MFFLGGNKVLNVFYYYSIIWGVVLTLYNLKLSDMNYATAPALNLFFLITIIISLFLGMKNRHILKYTHTEDTDHVPLAGLCFVAIAGVLDIIYAGDIPLFAIISGRRSYGEFNGLPLFHSILVNASIFYSAYFFYIFLETRQKKRLCQSFIPLIFLMLMFLKGAAVMCLFNFLNLSLAKASKNKKVLDWKKMTVIIMIGCIIIYINGGLTNLRSHYQWNDSHLILSVGKINSNWPAWLPEQFAWVYSYITSPLANLNLNITHYSPSPNSAAVFAVSLIPLIVSKNLFPDFGIAAEGHRLHTVVLNACTGFIDAVMAGGIAGIYLFAAILFLLLLLIIKYIDKFSVRRRRQGFCSVYYSLLCMLIVFMFFYNTFRDAATSLVVFFILGDLSRIRVRKICNPRLDAGCVMNFQGRKRLTDDSECKIIN